MEDFFTGDTIIIKRNGLLLISEPNPKGILYIGRYGYFLLNKEASHSMWPYDKIKEFRIICNDEFNSIKSCKLVIFEKTKERFLTLKNERL